MRIIKKTNYIIRGFYRGRKEAEGRFVGKNIREMCVRGYRDSRNNRN